MTSPPFRQPKLNPAQYRYVEQMRPGGTGLFVAGVGIGKSTLMREVACILAAYNPGERILLVSHVLAHARIEHVPALIARLKEYRNFSHEVKMDRLIVCRNGAVIQYGSADRPDTLDGWNVACVLCDEIRYWREEAYEKVTTRYRSATAPFPFMGMFTTPEMNWMYDRYFEYEAPGFFTVRGSTIENVHNLRKGYYEDLKARLSPKTFKQYVEGHWGLIEGAVFEDFNPSPEGHVRRVRHDTSLPVHMGIDFGYRCPAAIFFQHLDWCPAHGVSDCIHVLDELLPDNTTTEAFAPMITQLYHKRRWRMGMAYCDPAGSNRSQEVGYSSVDIMEAAGIPCEWTYEPASRFIPAGIDVIRSKILNVNNEISFYISDRCGRWSDSQRGLVRGLSRCEYPERKPGQALKDEPLKSEFTHVLDALRYAMVNLFPPTGGGVFVG